MLRKVRVKWPKAQSGLEVKMKAGLGFNANQLSWPVMAGEFSEPDLKERNVLGPTDWDNANLEAELGETVVTDLNNDGIPEQYKIGGKRHYDGGTPLNLPENSFIFSRDVTMKVKDPYVLEQFGITNAPKAGLTPADIAKKFDINKYKKVLLDKSTDDLAKKTAEMMITNYNHQLGKLAIVQESMKGFPDGMPTIAMPYLESIGIPPEHFLPKDDEEIEVEDQEETEDQGQQEEPEADMPTARYGRQMYQNGGGVKRKKGEKVDYNGTVLPPLADDPGTDDLDFDERLGSYNDEYKTLSTVLANNPKLQAEIAARYKANITKERNKIKDKTDAASKARLKMYDQLLNMTPEQTITLLKDYQKQVYTAQDYAQADPKNKMVLQGNEWNTTSNNTKNKKYKETMEALGYTGDELLDDTEAFGVQFLADAFHEATNDPEISKDLAEQGYKWTTWSSSNPAMQYSDTNAYNKNIKSMSRPDGVIGQRTIGLGLGFKKIDDKPVEETEKSGDTGGTDKTTNDIPTKKITGTTKANIKGTPWWAQDVIKFTGDVAEYGRIKKYLPWQAVPAVDFIEPTFYSPDRELAANAEQLAIGSQGLSNFTSPQAFTSRFSALAGQASQNAADIMARYNNLNVGVANEAEKFNTDIYNTYAAQRANDATELYDKVIIANQEYDNSRRKQRERMREGFVSGMTNAAMTAAMNQIYDNYQWDPRTNTPVFTGSAGDLEAQRQADYNAYYERAKAIKNKNADMTWREAMDLAGAPSKSSKNNPYVGGYPGYSNESDEEEDDE